MNLIHIESQKRTSGTPSNFTYTLPDTLTDISRIELVSVRIFNTIYNINSSNNVFPLSITTEEDTGAYFTIPEGSYTIVELIGYIQEQLDDVLDTPPLLSYDEKKMKLVLEVADSEDPYYFNFLMPNTPWFELGFEKQVYEFENVQTFVTPNVINLGMPLYINILIPEIGYHVFTKDSNDTTFVIPVNGQRGELIEYDRNKQYEQKIIFNRGTLFNLHISLVDENHTLVELNSDWDMLLRIES